VLHLFEHVALGFARRHELDHLAPFACAFDRSILQAPDFRARGEAHPGDAIPTLRPRCRVTPE
jgi:hypothetical protein